MKKLTQNKTFQAIFLFSLTAIVLFFLLKDNFNSVMNELLHMNLWWILVTGIFIFIYWVFKAIGNYILIRQIKPDFPLKECIKISLIAQFFNIITPFAAGGHPAQIHMLKKNDISMSQSTNITIQNFIVYQIAMVMIEGTGLIIALYHNLFGSNYLMLYMSYGGLILDFFIIFMLLILAFSKKTKYVIIKISITALTKLKFVKNKDETLENWNQKIGRFHKGAIELFKNKIEFGKAILANLVAIIIFYLTPLTLLYATGNYFNFSAFESIYIVACISMAADLVPTPGQLGGIEYGFTALFGKFVPSATLSAIIIAWRFLSYYLTLIIGGIALNIRKKTKNVIE